MTEPVGAVLGRVAEINRQLPPLLMDLLNEADPEQQAQQLRQLGQHLGSLSAECLARAAELDGRIIEAQRVIIDARP